MKKLTPIILGILFILIACNNQIGGVFPTPVPTNTVYKTPTPTVTKTKLILKTSSPAPTYTPSNTKTPEPTLPLGTLQAMSTIESLAVSFPEINNSWQQAISPNGNWVLFEDASGLNFINIKSKQKWTVNFYNIYGYQWDSFGGSVITNHWSKDGVNIYLEPHPDWDGPNLFFGSAATLIRFNLNNGEWEDLDVGNSFSISPNEKYLIHRSSNSIHIKILSTGETKLIEVPDRFNIFGRFVWSPDNERAMFTAADKNWYDMGTGFSLLLVDLNSSNLEILLENDKRLLYAYEWREEENIVLHSAFTEEVFYLGLSTRQITSEP